MKMDRIKALGLILDFQTLESVAEELLERLEQGLAEDGREIAMLPAYLAPPKASLGGLAMAIDAGGTNLRASLVEFGPEARPIGQLATAALPGTAGRDPATREQFFETHVAALRQLDFQPGLPLGYCFSYPIRSLSSGDAVLTKWTKEVRIDGMVQQPVGHLLKTHLDAAGLAPGPIFVLNDTIAGLMGGAIQPSVDPTRCVGLVVGTGTNLGAFLPTRRITKLDQGLEELEMMAVNFESGSYNPSALGPIDEVVDARSAKPGTQRFEKAVSGAYLGQVFKAAAELLSVQTPEQGTTEQVAALAIMEPTRDTQKLARIVLDRSADLVAAALAATSNLLGGSGELHVCAEGSLFWQGPGYRDRVRQTLDRLLASTESTARSRIFSVEGANLIGAAAAAASRA